MTEATTQSVTVRPDESVASEFSIPWNLSITALDKITKALYRSEADTKPVSAEDVSRVAGISKDTIAVNMKFLASVGLLMLKTGREYLLSAEGADYAKALDAGDLKNAGNILKKMLSSSPLRDVIAFAQVQGDGLSYETLFNQIRVLARIPASDQGAVADPAKAGIRCLIFLLQRAELVPAGVVDQLKAVKVAAGISKRPKQPREPAKLDTPPLDAYPPPNEDRRPNAISSPFTLNIQVEAKDPESIKEVIELIKYLRKTDDE